MTTFTPRPERITYLASHAGYVDEHHHEHPMFRLRNEKEWCRLKHRSQLPPIGCWVQLDMDAGNLVKAMVVRGKLADRIIRANEQVTT